MWCCQVQDAAGRGVKKLWHASWSIAHNPVINTVLQVAPIGDLEGSGGGRGEQHSHGTITGYQRNQRMARGVCGLLLGIARSGAWHLVVHDFVL